MKIERFDLDAKKQPVSEGYYVIRPNGRLILMPPTATELRAGYRLATQADVDAGKAVPAALDDVHESHLTEAQLAQLPGRVG